MRPDYPKKILLFILFSLATVSLIVAGCTFPGTNGAPATSATPAVPDNTPAQPTATPEIPTATTDPLADCPIPDEGTALYVNRGDGYCTLYPSHFKAQIDTGLRFEDLVLRGPTELLDPNQQEGLTVTLTIAHTGPPAGMDSAGYAARWLDLYAPDLEPAQQTVDFGGFPAVVIDGLPGFGPQRGAFIVADEARYSLMLLPQPGIEEELSDEAANAWETVSGSIVFFPPQEPPAYVLPEEVCPAESGDQNSYINLTDGYCMLYPADFALNSEFLPGEIVGGPVLDNVENFGDVRTSLTVGTFGYFKDQTPREVLESRIDQIDAGSIQETIIGGQPAVTFIDPRGPWASQQAMISVNGMIYTIVAQPYEPDRYPEGLEFLNQMWDAVTGSLAFFTPWR